jgi:hypothetical protein
VKPGVGGTKMIFAPRTPAAGRRPGCGEIINNSVFYREMHPYGVHFKTGYLKNNILKPNILTSKSTAGFDFNPIIL